MKTINPEAQILVNKYNELVKKISNEGMKGEPNEEDMDIFEQMGEINTKLSVYNTSTVIAMIGTRIHGYDVNITINGKDLGISGDNSTSSRLFDIENIMALVATPDVVAHNFVLNSGKNTLILKYKKNTEEDVNTLNVNIRAYEDDDTILSIDVKDKSEGTIEKTFILEPTKPADFQTITLSE